MKKRKLRKEIRMALAFIRDAVIVCIGAVGIVALLIGAAVQEQDKLAEMAMQEVQR